MWCLVRFGVRLAGIEPAGQMGYAEASVKVLKERIEPTEWTAREPIEAAHYDAVLSVPILESARKVNRQRRSRGLLARRRSSE